MHPNDWKDVPKALAQCGIEAHATWNRWQLSLGWSEPIAIMPQAVGQECTPAAITTTRVSCPYVLIYEFGVHTFTVNTYSEAAQAWSAASRLWCNWCLYFVRGELEELDDDSGE